MKTKTSLCLLALTGAAACFFQVPLHAQALVTLGGYSTVPDGGVAPGGTTNYQFFGLGSGRVGAGGQPSSLTNFAETTPPPMEFDGAGLYSNLQPPGGGTVFGTGLGYVPVDPAGSADIVTYTVNAGTGANQSLSIYVLYGNSDGNSVFDSMIHLSINAGMALNVPILDTTFTNDFVEFNVTGVNPGDTITIGATAAAVDAKGNTTGFAYIGGVAIVPEPSTWAMMLGGLGLLSGVGRYRRTHRA